MSVDELGHWVNTTNTRQYTDVILLLTRIERRCLEPLEQQLLAEIRLELLVVSTHYSTKLLPATATVLATRWSPRREYERALPGSPTLPGDLPEQADIVDPLIYHSATDLSCKPH